MADAPVTPQVETPPQPPPAKEPAQQTPASGQPSAGLDPNQLIEFSGPDGSIKYMTIGQMVEKVNTTGPAIDPEKLSKLEVWEKAMAGDPEATRKMVESYLPPAPPKALDPAEQIAALQQEVVALKAQVGQVAPTVQQIEHLRHRSQIGNVIDMQKDKVPYTAKHPKGADMVLALYRQHATAQKIGENDPRAMNLLAGVMVQVENELKTTAELYRGFGVVDPNATNGLAGKVVDDQNKNPASIPAKLAFINGRLVDERGREVAQGPDRVFREVSANVPSTLPTGASVPATMPTTPRGPMTRSQMDEENRRLLSAKQG